MTKKEGFLHTIVKGTLFFFSLFMDFPFLYFSFSIIIFFLMISLYSMIQAAPDLLAVYCRLTDFFAAS